MGIFKANFVLALCIGTGMFAATTIPTFAQQDRSAQSQEKQSAQKPAAHGKQPQQHAAQRPSQGKPATSRPQASHTQTARPAHTTKPAAKPSHPQASHPQTGKPAATRPSHNTGHNNARPTTKPAARPSTRPAARPAQGRPSNGRPATKPGARPNYQFRSQDTTRLRNYYRGSFGKINRGNRPSFSRGGYVPRTYWTYFQPVPASLIGYLPPVPPGYAIGYYDGYIIVYDPSTWFILSVLNILQ